MRKTIVVLTAVAVMAVLAVPAFADLQNVTVDGKLRIRYNNWNDTFISSGGVAVQPGGGLGLGAHIVWPGMFLPVRPIGSIARINGILGTNAGLNGITSIFGFDNNQPKVDFVEQRTRLGVQADFTNEIAAYIELDSYDIWGEDFRSDYLTGADFPAFSGDDVEVYQGYIEVKDMWGLPLRARIGRQELALGSQWLVGVNDANAFFTGLSFDGVRYTYATDMFSVDAFYTMLAENSPIEEDGDVTFAGVYASYLGLEDITLDAYWLWLRDPRSINDTDFLFPLEWLENAFDLDDYDVTNIHTFGLRGAGTFGAFDFEAEAAYQIGDVGQYGATFRPFGLYGDDNLDMNEWGANLEVGYTFDMNYQPRVFLGGAYFSADSNRDVSFWDWINPFDRPQGSTSFNRLFSNWEYSQFLDQNGSMSNVGIIRGGVSAMPTESLELKLMLTYLTTLEEFEAPVSINLGRYRIPIAPALSFWTNKNDKDLGYELGLYATYNYSEDLTFNAGWAHFFVGNGLEDGQFVVDNGYGFAGGSQDDDADYFFVESKIAF